MKKKKKKQHANCTKREGSETGSNKRGEFKREEEEEEEEEEEQKIFSRQLTLLSCHVGKKVL